MKRLPAKEAAKKFVDMEYPNCDGALLAGSVVRGEATQTSDLDIVIFDQSLTYSYRESLIKFDWPIEVFVHNLASYKSFIAMDAAKGLSSLPRMVVDGFVLRDLGMIDKIKEEAQELIDKGPSSWSMETIQTRRYTITDMVDDLLGSKKREEDICIVMSVAPLIPEFYLRTNHQWIGESKWIHRALKKYDPSFANRYTQAFEDFFQTGTKAEIVNIIDEVLAPFGGRLFEGFSLGKQ
ncbi:nucleotidyltransferase domain-containing protein [Paraliobacillus zengyii]|uniref:nucleotidyltransferase domain-containing protein n=1 Tax=Paraliobacillus TaxID=200903 RepID=UPI002FCDA9D5